MTIAPALGTYGKDERPKHDDRACSGHPKTPAEHGSAERAFQAFSQQLGAHSNKERVYYHAELSCHNWQ
jgi:hypothetical protein